MVAVNVRTGSSRLWGICTAWPVHISTAIVSPIARPTPKSTAANRPFFARRKQHAVDDLPAAGAQRQGGLAVAIGHGLQGVLAHGDDDRHAHQRQDDAAVEQIDAHRGTGQPNDDRPEHHVADESPDDRRNGRQKFDEDFQASP